MMLRNAILQKNLANVITQIKEEEIPNVLGLKWNNLIAQNRANMVTQKLGDPDIINVIEGGVVKWKLVEPLFREHGVVRDPDYDNNLKFLGSKDHIKSTKYYSELMIKDEEIPHLVPAPHIDCWYAKMYMDIPVDKINDVLNLTESVSYDTMKKEISARCHIMAANLVTLYLAKQIAVGDKNLAHAQQEYSVLIPILAAEEKSGRGLLSNSPGNWHITLSIYLFDMF